ncbi:MAG: hypothetical protein JO081_09750 [Alphaproteobacteria bacterium]|nr:hypothetical protein [Alphaproteobacteria bacterium]
MVETSERALQQFEFARQLVHGYRRILAAAKPPERIDGPLLLDEASGFDPPATCGFVSATPRAQDSAASKYRVSFLNRLAKGGATVTGCRRSIVVCSAISANNAIEIARKRFAERYGVNDQQIGTGIVEIERLG